MKKILSVLWLACCACLSAVAQDNVIDEIVWVVGDDAILRSDATEADKLTSLHVERALANLLIATNADDKEEN